MFSSVLKSSNGSMFHEWNGQRSKLKKWLTFIWIDPNSPFKLEIQNVSQRGIILSSPCMMWYCGLSHPKNFKSFLFLWIWMVVFSVEVVDSQPLIKTIFKPLVSMLYKSCPLCEHRVWKISHLIGSKLIWFPVGVVPFQQNILLWHYRLLLRVLSNYLDGKHP